MSDKCPRCTSARRHTGIWQSVGDPIHYLCGSIDWSDSGFRDRGFASSDLCDSWKAVNELTARAEKAEAELAKREKALESLDMITQTFWSEEDQCVKSSLESHCHELAEWLKNKTKDTQ